ncbi:MAG: ECF transporter S component [Lactobacillus sp.]|jgi:riboflavin transporter FmnP|nr:ECF transporter S component [Lactobacillus sp.]
MQKEASTEKIKLRYWVAWAVIAAIAFLIMKFEFPVIPVIPYLKMDFSDVIVAMSTFIFGPLGGTMVAFFKSLINYLISGANILSLIGDTAAFLASIAFALPMYYLSKKHPDKNSYKILGIIVGILSMTIVMSVMNAFILTPMYVKFANFTLPHGMLSYIFTAIVPFNLAKGLVNGVIVFALWKSVIPQLRKYVARHF